MGITLIDEGEGWLEAQMVIAPQHLRSGTNALHAASMIALADSVCGFASGNVLPEGAKGYTTIELKSNFLGTANEGTLIGGQMRNIWGAPLRFGVQLSRTRKRGANARCFAALR